MPSFEDQLNRVHTLVGRITTDFSSIEQLWYLIFTALLHDTPRPAVDAIFNQHRIGAAQRQLILDVANAVLPGDSKLRLSITQLCGRTANLSVRRNAVVHSVFYVAEFIIPPRIAAAGISKPSGMKTAGIETEIADIYREVVSLELDMQQLRLEAMRTLPPGLIVGFDFDAQMQQLESRRRLVQSFLASDPILRAAASHNQLPAEPSEA
jgi:hypothetical protein